MLTDGYFKSFDGTKIHYQKTPGIRNKCLIFLHGLGGDLTAWQKERAYFTDMGIPNIAIDLRGHGLSERSDEKDFYKLENFAKDITVLMEEEKLTNAIVIGHCFGGMVSIYFQSQYPKHSKGLVLIDTSYKPPFVSDRPTAQALFKQLIAIVLKVAPNLKAKGHRNFDKYIGTGDFDIKRLSGDILHTSLHSYLLICNHLIDLDVKKLLDKITVPSLIIEGLNDTVFPEEIAEYLSKRIKKSELDLIPGANHILVINNPEDLQKDIESFLKKIAFI